MLIEALASLVGAFLGAIIGSVLMAVLWDRIDRRNR